MSSRPSSVKSQVHCASGVKSLTTGLKSMTEKAFGEIGIVHRAGH
jgi:hypothetical protein